MFPVILGLEASVYHFTLEPFAGKHDAGGAAVHEFPKPSRDLHVR